MYTERHLDRTFPESLECHRPIVTDMELVSVPGSASGSRSELGLVTAQIRLSVFPTSRVHAWRCEESCWDLELPCRTRRPAAEPFQTEASLRHHRSSDRRRCQYRRTECLNREDRSRMHQPAHRECHCLRVTKSPPPTSESYRGSSSSKCADHQGRRNQPTSHKRPCSLSDQSLRSR